MYIQIIKFDSWVPYGIISTDDEDPSLRIEVLR